MEPEHDPAVHAEHGCYELAMVTPRLAAPDSKSQQSLAGISPQDV